MATSQLAPAASRQPRPRQLRPGLRGVPVFLYHGLAASLEIEVPSRERKYWVSEARFGEHLALMRHEGYRIALLREIWNSPDVFFSAAPAAALTFDDGNVSDYQTAFPLLLAAGLRADFFVNTSTVGGEGFLHWAQVAEMHRFGMSFQSHSRDHVDLLRVPPQALERQLRDSRRMLEDRLGCAVEFLSAPYGRVNGRVVEAARQAGYRAVCNSRSWPAQPGAPTVNRVVIYAHTSGRDFRGLLARRPSRYAARAIRGSLLYLPKHLLLRLRPAQFGARVLEEKA